MPISIEEVERIAKLARLSFGSEEKIKLQKELSAILDYVDQLKKVETKSAVALSEGGEDPDSINLMRDDFASSVLPPEELLKIAPDTESGFYKVKSVLE
ncbi:MAG: Asp-tRNA(Asn)/Glu-tRNA(Gln) amidotransferase subunit GatC [Candidatus Doudnabacteria bacterium]|nr:Asp-tRNA(Asn)/Glu-tRNA(Gln) amidotransferase subunit GatC [Candidatus Doudnabacteria bacterium]